MKATILLLIALLCLICNSKAQCNTNAEFAVYDGNIKYTSYDASPYFPDGSLSGWVWSHGTPQILKSTTPKIRSAPYDPIANPYDPKYNEAFMWAKGEGGRYRGEGIKAPFSFIKNRNYIVSVFFYTTVELPNSPSNTEIRLVAATNVYRPTVQKVGNLDPGADAQQRIGTPTDRISGWHLYSKTFTADNNYNTFWIYPYTTDANQYNLFIEYISICEDPCTADIYYKNGTLPTGTPQTYGQVYIGTSFGGSGIVTNDPAAQTTITASNQIVIKPEFLATVTSQGQFIAKIASCTTMSTSGSRLLSDTGQAEPPVPDPHYIDNSTYADEYGTVSSLPRIGVGNNNKDMLANESQSVAKLTPVFPNPTQIKLNVTINGEKEYTTNIKIFNSQGSEQKSWQCKVPAGGQTFKIDVTTLPVGMYLIQYSDYMGKPIVQKFTKTK